MGARTKVQVASRQVPAPLLLDPDLPASAKVVWMVLRQEAGPAPGHLSLASLQAKARLSRPTIRHGLARLVAAGWCSTATGTYVAVVRPAVNPPAQPSPRARPIPRAQPIPPAPAGTATVPAELLSCPGVGTQAKVLFGVLQLLVTATGPPGEPNATQTPRTPAAARFSYAILSQLTGRCRNTVKRAIRDLIAEGWLEVNQKNRHAPIHFTTHNPVRAPVEAKVIEMETRLAMAAFTGQAIALEHLSLLAATDAFEDNARPGFLINAYTGERMELDRLYHIGVAFEFNGPQHYGPTERFPDPMAATKQEARDYIKAGLCARNGIKLIVLNHEDLTLETMRAKVAASGLPLRPLDGLEPLLEALNRVSQRYRATVRRGGRSARFTPFSTSPSAPFSP